MISTTVIIAFAAALLLTLALPLIVLPILGAKKKLSWKPLGLGALSFLVSQLLLRMPLLQQLSTQQWYMSLSESAPLLISFMLAFSAGLFEESARLGGVALLGKKDDSPGYRTWHGALAFGLGHGCCEVVLLIGLTHLNNFLICMILNTGGTELMASILSPEQAVQIAASFSSISPADIAAGLLERVSALMFHLFATSLVFLGFIRKKLYLYVLAIVIHTVFNCVGLLPIGIWPIEIILFAMGTVFLLLFIRSRKYFPKPASAVRQAASFEMY